MKSRRLNTRLLRHAANRAAESEREPIKVWDPRPERPVTGCCGHTFKILPLMPTGERACSLCLIPAGTIARVTPATEEVLARTAANRAGASARARRGAQTRKRGRAA